ncbi:hypothetical protein F5X96DRAFT_690760 [Biscogniauxia mediterranea]|nr:hypothetical protein F5X96DRAFT_690760 [Biscogniauxia mediterranea]
MALSSPMATLYPTASDSLLSSRASDSGSCITASQAVSPGESQTANPTPIAPTSSSLATGSSTAPILSYGAVAGIVVGVIVGVGITVVVFYLFLTRTRLVEKRQARQLEEREKWFRRKKRNSRKRRQKRMKNMKNEDDGDGNKAGRPGPATATRGINRKAHDANSSSVDVRDGREHH